MDTAPPPPPPPPPEPETSPVAEAAVPPPPPSPWAPPAPEAAAPPSEPEADAEHEAEAVLRELEEEIARETAAAADPSPEGDDVADAEPVTDDEQSPDVEPVAADAPPDPPQDEAPQDEAPPAEAPPPDATPAEPSQFSGWPPTRYDEAPPAPPQDETPPTGAPTVPTGWLIDDEPTPADSQADAASVDHRPPPPVDADRWAPPPPAPAVEGTPAAEAPTDDAPAGHEAPPPPPAPGPWAPPPPPPVPVPTADVGPAVDEAPPVPEDEAADGAEPEDDRPPPPADTERWAAPPAVPLPPSPLGLDTDETTAPAEDSGTAATELVSTADDTAPLDAAEPTDEDAPADQRPLLPADPDRWATPAGGTPTPPTALPPIDLGPTARPPIDLGPTALPPIDLGPTAQPPIGPGAYGPSGDDIQPAAPIDLSAYSPTPTPTPEDTQPTATPSPIDLGAYAQAGREQGRAAESGEFQPPPPAPGTYGAPGMHPSGPGFPVVRTAQAPWWKKQSTLIAGAATILVVLLGVFAFVVFQKDDPSLTFNGESIEDAEATLTSAESTVTALVEERHGASNDDTRCYFSLKSPEETDVATFLRCGPVLFVDGKQDEPYLTFPLSEEEAEGDGVRLVAADQPETPEPAKLGAGEELRRPDDAGPPDGAGGLEVPLPQRADAGLFEANPLEGVELETPAAQAEIVSYGTSYQLTGFAEPERYGSGDAARRPARGEKFVAVQFSVGLGEFPLVADAPTVALQIGSEAAVPLPGADPEATIASMIVSVPEDTDVVDLVVTEQGVEQRLSLLTGEPGPNNIAVLRRSTLDQTTSASADMSFSASRPGYVTETFSVNVGVNVVRLFWFFGEGGVQHPSGPGRAWLVPETTHAWGPGLAAGPDVSLDPEFFKLTLVDGTVIGASNLATDGRILVAFDVPADMSQATLTVGGVVTRFNGETWDFGATSLSVPLNIPTG